MRVTHVLVRLAAVVVIAVSLLLVVNARVRMAAVDRRADCFRHAVRRFAPEFENHTVLAARACRIPDPAPDLPVGVPTPYE